LDVNSIFEGDPDGTITVDVNAPVSNLSGDDHGFYLEAYSKASISETDRQAGAILKFLAVIMGMVEKFDDPQQPYGPFRVEGDRRSAIPTDLSTSDIAMIRRLAPVAEDAFVRARLHDLLWIAAKDVAAGKAAAKCYMALGGSQCEVPNRWTQAILSFSRGLQILGAFGRDKPLFQEAIAQLEAAAAKAAATPGDFRSLKLIRILLKNRATDPAKIIPLLESNAAHAEAAGDYRRAQKYRDMESDWRRFTGDNEAAKAAKLASAHAALKLAEDRAVGPTGSAMAASALMSEAIEALGRAEAGKAAIDAARKRLRELQEASLGELKTYSFEMDISGAIEEAKEHVRCRDFKVALRRLVLGVQLVKPEAIRAEVIKTAKENPLHHLFASSLLDSKGRPIAKTAGLLNEVGDDAEAALRAEMFSYAEQFNWRLRVSAFIEPARQQIRNDHHPNFDDLLFLVLNNPFVPLGHEGIFLRGLHAGFHGDFLIASHLLVPQIENSIRHVLEGNDVDVSVYKPDGTQPVKILGGILGHPRTTGILGDDLVFELQGALIEKTGFDLRNRIAHGFISEAECFTESSVFIWWHVLRMCLVPMLVADARARASGKDDGQAEGGAPSGPAS